MAYSFLFGGNTKETPDTLSRKREMADLLASQLMGDTPKNAYEGIGAMLKGAAVGIGRHRDGKAEKAGRSAADDLFKRIIGQAPDVSASSMLSPGIKPASTSTSAGTGAAASVNVDPSIRDGIVQTASALGVDPVDLATAISYETAGTFDPTKAGPTTTWGKHRGLIQFGEPQAQQYGVNWDDPVGSQLGENGAVAKYLRSTGVKPGMGLLDIYSAINAGGVGRYNASDAAAGGAPGTVRDKVEKQMAGHRAKALALFGDQGQEVASLDPSIGMPPQTAAGAVNALAAGGGGGAPPPSLSEEVAAFEQTPEYQAQFPGRNAQQPSQGPIQNAPQQQPAIPPQFQGSQQLANAQGGIIPALMDGSPASPEQVAQAQAMGQQQAPQQAPAQARPAKMALLQALSNPWLSQEQKAVLQTLYQQQEQEEQAAREQQTWLQRQQYEQEVQRNDPKYQLDLQKGQIELEEAKKPKRQPLINAGNGNVYDPNQDKWLTAPSGSGDGSFRFNGNSVEAQALNGLMESGQLTPEQAQQLAAGKTISGPNGEIIFLTPQGVFGQSSAGGQPQQMSGSRSASNQPPQQMQPQSQMPGQPGQGGNIQITPPKVTVDEKEAATFADRMNTSGGLIDQFEGAGLGVWDQAVRGNDYIPDFLENWMVSDDFQNFDQARRDFINAQLRRESGAVISAEEFDNANKQYFPQPGDTREVLEQKRRNRQTVVDGMKRSAGPTYGRSNNDGADPLGIR
ncbi:hypothetical protein [Sinorhizobium medicae]